MDQRKLTCSCGQQFNEEDFTRHYTICVPFKQQFKEFDSKFGELLKSYSEPKERLLIVKFLLKQYIFVIDKKLKKYFAGLSQYQGSQPPRPYDVGAPPGMDNNHVNNNVNYRNPINNDEKVFRNPNPNPYVNNSQNSHPNPYVNNLNKSNKVVNNDNDYVQNFQNSNENVNKNINPNSINPYKQSVAKDDDYQQNFQNKSNNSNPYNNQPNQNNMGNNNDFSNDFYSQPIQNGDNDNNLTLCQICKLNPDVVYLSCVHPICKNCFLKCAEQNFYEMKCKVCSKPIDEPFKKLILGEEKLQQLENNALMGIIGANLVKCPYPDCGEQNAFEPGQVDYNVRDDKNQKMSPQAAEDYAKHRCRCGFCRKDFCMNKDCLAMPYHLGMTCQKYKEYIESKKCRYCDKLIKNFNRGPDDDVCDGNECKERYYISCKKRLPCGHKCFGVNGELNCPPCIDKECQQYGGKLGQNKDEYCTICYTEGLGSSPMVVLSCGHYLHYQCVKKRLETKWIGPKITFNHCICPACNRWFDCQDVPELQKMIDVNKKLYEEIKDMALKRLKFEDLDKDPRLSDPNSPWFGKKVEFAMKRLTYYMCYVCKKPYFAGRRECGNDPNMNNDDPNKNYNPKDCVCGKDANLSGVAGKTDCPKHGKDFIEYKCKFCCKIASWFCWGTTHFCEDCHRRQCNNDYVSKYPRDRLPKCNKSTCEVGGNHPPNGEEYALGCSICRNSEENHMNF